MSSEIQRHITQKDRENARRLNRIWHAKIDDLSLTQELAAQALGIGQSAVSQYLNCRIALNLETIIAFAALLGCDPQDIDPDLDFLSPMANKAECGPVRTFRVTITEEPAPPKSL